MAGTILHVDDAPVLPEGSDRELQRLGFRLTHTDRVEEALRLAREGVPRLILLEVLLPSGEGWELLEQVRSWQGPAGRVPVVVLTRGERSPALYGRALELGADDFLSKPVLRAELLAAVLECTQGEETGAVDPADGDETALRQSAFSGDLAQCPLPELFVRLRRVGASGVLLVQSEAENRGIQLRNGSPVAVASNRGVESLEDFLVRTKQISGEEHERVVEQAHAGGGSARELLLELGILSEGELRSALAQRAAEPVLEGFGWEAGSYRLEKGRRLPAGSSLELDQSPGRLLMNGVLEWAPSGLVRKLLDRRAGHYPAKVEHPLYDLGELGGLACDSRILDGLVGDRTVAEVLGSGELDERMLYGLLVAGLLELQAEPIMVLREVLEPVSEQPEPREPEPLEEDFPEDGVFDGFEAPADGATSVRAAAVAGSAPAPGGTEGVAQEAPSDSESAGDPEQGATRALEAESWFRKGEGHLERRAYDRAVEAFGMAAHLDPSQGEYTAHLGYALHLSQPHNALVAREAMEHIAKGIKSSPDRWKPLVFLGRVFKATGERDNAIKVFRRALKVQPDCHEARLELRLLAQPRAPEGLLARVGRWFSGRRRSS